MNWSESYEKYLEIICKEAEALNKENAVPFGELHEDYIVIPHRLPPFVRSAFHHPPVEDEDFEDQYVAGDHDAHACVPLLEAWRYSGHQSLKVHSLCEKHLTEDIWAGRMWVIQAIASHYSLYHYLDEEFDAVSNHADWDGWWPVIDENGDLTGQISEGGEGYLVTDDHNAVISEADAVRAGAAVRDGYATLLEG